MIASQKFMNIDGAVKNTLLPSLLGVMVCLLLLSVAAPSAIADTDADTQIAWLDYSAAQRLNPPSGKKIFIYFASANCTYCRLLEKETFTNTDIITYINANFTPVRVNIDRERKVAAQFRIQGVPDLRFLTAKGEPIGRWPGYIEAGRLLTMLKYIGTDSYLKMSFTDFAGR